MCVKEMMNCSEKEVGCDWCRFMALKLNGYVVLCASFNRHMIRQAGDSCPKFLRALNADEFYQLRLTDKASVCFPGRLLNFTGIMPNTLISSDQLYQLLRLATYTGPVQLKLEEKNV